MLKKIAKLELRPTSRFVKSLLQKAQKLGSKPESKLKKNKQVIVIHSRTSSKTNEKKAGSSKCDSGHGTCGNSNNGACKGGAPCHNDVPLDVVQSGEYLCARQRLQSHGQGSTLRACEHMLWACEHML